MGLLLIAYDHVRHIDDLSGDVGVVVQGNDDWYVFSDDPPYRGE